MFIRAPIAALLVWVLASLILLVVAAMVWVTVQSSLPPRWISVQGPSAVEASTHATVQVHLGDGVHSGYLSLDLHWMERGPKSRGFLSRAIPQLVKSTEATYTFDPSVPSRPDLASVFAVIWLSPNGQWQPDARTVWTEPIPVREKAETEMLSQPRTLRIYERESWRPAPPTSRLASGLTAAAWLCAGALGAWTACGRTKPHPRDDRRWTVWLVPLACGLAGWWEVFSADAVLASWFRQWAVAQHSYQGRQVYQVAASWVLAAGLAYAGFRAVRRGLSSGHRALMLGFSLYVSLAGVAVVSLHAADRIANLTWGTIPALQWLKLIAATAVLSVVGGNGRSAEEQPVEAESVPG